MEKTPTSARMQSVDALRGAIIIIMALDHVRDFTNISAMSFSPTDCRARLLRSSSQDGSLISARLSSLSPPVSERFSGITTSACCRSFRASC
jgi:uncharacterized membrane protein